jgi:hypothetical protein
MKAGRIAGLLPSQIPEIVLAEFLAVRIIEMWRAHRQQSAQPGVAGFGQ